MDDLLEASGDLVVADLALLAGHDLAELPDSLHRGAPLRRTVEAAISLVGLMTTDSRCSIGSARDATHRQVFQAFSETDDEMFKYQWFLRMITSIPPQRAVPWIS